MSLVLDNVTAGYGSVTVIREVTMEINKGEFVALVGANGAGKTTLLRLVSGLIHPREGQISWNDNSLLGLKPHEVVHSGVVQVPEGRQLFPKMTVFDNLLCGSLSRRARAERRKTLNLVFEFFPVLKSRQHQVAHTLSGGEQQMLAIGRGLMALPEILLLDEPSVGLAPLVVKEVYEKLFLLRDQGLTILLSEQNVVAALSAAERAFVLENGRIAMQGKSAVLLQDPEIKKSYLGL